MDKNKGLVILTTVAGAFISGIALGLLLSPKSGRENREYLLKSADDMSDWVTVRSRLARQKANEKVGELRRTVNKTVNDSLPNLYDTIDELRMSEDDVKGVRDKS